MLFDLEDYKSSGIIGTASLPSNQIYWPDAYTTSRATMDAYTKSVREYYFAALHMSCISESPIMDAKYLDFLEAYMVFRPMAKTFWHAMVSLPIAGQLIDGDRFDIIAVGKYDENESHLSYPSGSPQNTWWNENYKNVAIANAEGEFIYTEMGQAIYDDYKLSLKDFMSKSEEIMIIGEGGVALSGYVAPVVPAWDSYPELSGYVRGTNNLSIIDAVVRLVDLDGVNHDVVTDENGFYKFSKEMFYNSIAFDHTAPLSTFNMFLLEHTLGSTASLYDPTSLLQNSFFGAENDRGLTWPMSVKMDRSPRRNFKLEFLPDYSSYPSVSGTILDQDGNPVVNALVKLEYSPLGKTIGSLYNTANGQFTLPAKYKLFGIEKSILTDENGYYEYSSQMVGEWFNNQLKKAEPNFQYSLNYNPNKNIEGVTMDGLLSNTSGFTNNGAEMGWGRIYGVEQEDGKIVVAGLGFNEYNGVSTGCIFRMNSNGTIDDTFQVTVSNYDNYSYIQGIEKQADGKIIIAGQFDSVNGSPAYSIARLNSDGTIDATFNNNRLIYSSEKQDGVWRTDSQHYTNVIKLQPDGKILVGGYFYVPSVNMYGLIRLNSDGTIDETFINGLDENGQPTLDSNDNLIYGGTFEDPFAIDLQSDGKILVGGSQWNGWFLDGSNIDWQNPPTTAIYRLNSDGTLDDTFSVGSAFWKSEQESGPYSKIHTIKVDHTGKILVGGKFIKFGNQPANNILRLNSDGTLDTAFPGLNWNGDSVEPWSNYVANNMYPGIDGNSPYANPVESIYVTEDKILVFGSIQRTREDVGGMITINHDGTIDQLVNNNKFLGFTNTQSKKPSVLGYAKLSNGSIMAFGSFAFFNDGNSSFGNGPQDTIPNCHGVAKLKIFQMGLYAPVGDFGSYYGNLSLNVPALPLESDGSFRINANTVRVTYIPYTQDPNSMNLFDTMYPADEESESALSRRIYDRFDWFNSRFQYAANERNEAYFRMLIPGENIINVTETLTQIEDGAERVYFTPDAGTVYPEGSWQGYNIATTTGFFKVKWASGEEQIMGWSGNLGSNGYDNQPISFSFYTGITGGPNEGPLYIYSCEGEHGSAYGKIWGVFDDCNHNTGDKTSFDIDELTDLRKLRFSYTNLESFDFSNPALSKLSRLEVENSPNLKLTNLDQLVSSNNIYIDISGNNYSRKDISTEAFIRDFREEDLLNHTTTSGRVDGEIYKAELLDNGDTLIVGSFNTIYDSSIDINNALQIPVSKIALLKPDYTIVPFYNDAEHQFNGSINNFKIFEDGSILVVGGFTSVSKSDGTSFSTNGIAKLTIDGLIDETFMARLTNPVEFKINSNGYFEWDAMLVQPDGKIILGQRDYSSSTQMMVQSYTNYDNTVADYSGWGDFVSEHAYFSVMRINPDGLIDNTFNAYKESGNDGMLNFGHITGCVYGLVPYSETQFFIHGWMGNKRYMDANGDFYEGGYTQPLILMDYDGNVCIDNANANLYLNCSNANIVSLKVQADGKILLSGSLSSLIPNVDPNIPAYQIPKLVYGAWATFARLNSDFTPDEAFMNNILVHSDENVFIDLLPNGDIRLISKYGGHYAEPNVNSDDYYDSIVTLNSDGTLKSKEYPRFNGAVRGIFEHDGYSIVYGGFYQVQNGRENVYSGCIIKLERVGFSTYKLELPNTPTDYVRIYNNNIVDEIIAKSTTELVIDSVYSLNKVDLSQITNIDKLAISGLYMSPQIYLGTGNISMLSELVLSWANISDISFISSMSGLKKFIYNGGNELVGSLDLSFASVLEELHLSTPSAVIFEGLNSLKILALNNMNCGSLDLSLMASTLEELNINSASPMPDLSSLPSMSKLLKLTIGNVYEYTDTPITIENSNLENLYLQYNNRVIILNTPSLVELTLDYQNRPISSSIVMNNLQTLNVYYGGYYFKSLDLSYMPNLHSFTAMGTRYWTSLDLSPLVSITSINFTIWPWEPGALQTFTMPSSDQLDYIQLNGLHMTSVANTDAKKKALLTSIWSGLASHSKPSGYINYPYQLQSQMDSTILAYRNTKPYWSIGLN